MWPVAAHANTVEAIQKQDSELFENYYQLEDAAWSKLWEEEEAPLMIYFLSEISQSIRIFIVRNSSKIDFISAINIQ